VKTIKPLHIIVMRGGPSAEREVSLRSGASVARALESLGHTVQRLDPLGEDWQLPKNTDVVFLALHGTYGEDGTIQRRLEAMGVPFTGCDSQASALAFDKVAAKEKFLAAGLPTAAYQVIQSPDASWPAGWQPPVVLKPVRQGSSVGLCFVEQRDQWTEALKRVLEHDTAALLEEKICGREATVGILADRLLPVVEVRPRQGAYDYHNKYTVGATEYFCPAPFDQPTTERLQQTAWAAFQALGGRDYGRVDLMVRPSGEPVLLEVNTLPGMTETSLLPKAAAAAGLEYAALCQSMVELAWQRRTPSLRSEQGD
jgi:D-alanine-D-alanine ligase